MTKQGMLTKNEREVFERLLEDKSFKGKKSLRHLLWLNSNKPKYQIGDFFKVTDRSVSFFGVRAENINARIVEVTAISLMNEYQYTLEAHIVNKDGRETIGTICALESELTVKVKDAENRVDGNGKYAESIAV